MLDKIDRDLRFQQEALHLLDSRQNILAANIANADTPGYRARDIDFSAQLQQAVSQGRNTANGVSLTLTSGRHIAVQPFSRMANDVLYRIPDQPSADGNTVDMDRERVQFADNSVKYQTGLTLINSQLKSMMTVLSQG